MTYDGGAVAPDVDSTPDAVAPADVSSLEPVSLLLTRVATQARDAIPGADGAGLTVFDLGRPDIVARSTPFVERIDDIQYGLGEGPCITAADEARTIRSGRLETESRWPQFGPSAAALGVHSVLSLPLLSAERVLGTVNVYAHQRSAFSSRAIELGEHFAMTATVAVNHARVVSAGKRLASNLTLALVNRATIDQAVGVLIATEALSPDRALARLTAFSHENGLSLVNAANLMLEHGMARAAAQLAGR